MVEHPELSTQIESAPTSHGVHSVLDKDGQLRPVQVVVPHVVDPGCHMASFASVNLQLMHCPPPGSYLPGGHTHAPLDVVTPPHGELHEADKRLIVVGGKIEVYFSLLITNVDDDAVSYS